MTTDTRFRWHLIWLGVSIGAAFAVFNVGMRIPAILFGVAAVISAIAMIANRLLARFEKND